jgi:hypothetical protein
MTSFPHKGKFVVSFLVAHPPCRAESEPTLRPKLRAARPVFRETPPCDELGGQGWRVLVLSATPTTSTIRFTHARHRGRRYEDIQVQTSSLMLIKPLDTLDQQGP